jgi:hypothetical protein
MLPQGPSDGYPLITLYLRKGNPIMAKSIVLQGEFKPGLRSKLFLGVVPVIFALVLITACDVGTPSNGNNTGTPPSAPTGVTATPANGQVTISWTAVSGANSYNIYWSVTSGVTKTNGTKITGANSPYVQTGLTNGIPYSGCRFTHLFREEHCLAAGDAIECAGSLLH